LGTCPSEFTEFSTHAISR